MTKILCATRGGGSSYQTQDKVIARAKAEKAELVFVFAVDVEFLSTTAAPILVDVESELDNMAEFLMLMAQERAQKAGIEAKTIVKRGNLGDVLVEAAAEEKADVIVLGSPAEESRFAMEGLKAFAAAVEKASGVKVEIV